MKPDRYRFHLPTLTLVRRGSGIARSPHVVGDLLRPDEIDYRDKPRPSGLMKREAKPTRSKSLRPSVRVMEPSNPKDRSRNKERQVNELDQVLPQVAGFNRCRLHRFPPN